MRKQFTLFLLIIGTYLFSGCAGRSGENIDKKITGDLVTLKQSANPDKIVAIGRIEPELKIIKLSSEVSGVIKEVKVQPGDKVKAGDILIRLSDNLEAQQVSETQATIESRRAEINTTNANIEAAKVKLAFAQSKYQRLKQAYEKQAEFLQNVENAENEVKTAQKEIERLNAQLNIIEQQIKEANRRTATQQVVLQRRTITAPLNGTILTMDLMPGMAVQALTTIGEFAPEGPITALCEVDELFADKVKIGMKSYIRKLGMQDTIATGEVIFIAPALKKKSLFSENATELEDRRVREVRIRLTNSDRVLIGMRVECVVSLQ